MQEVRYHEIECKSAMHGLGRGKRVPYKWDLNIYKGCVHGCKYCFAQYTAGYMGAEDFFRDIYVKTNIAEMLERELRKSSWKCEVVNIGGVTDTYQAAEAKYRIMPDIWKLMIKYRTPVIVSTKSDLILRDFDYIAELSRMTYVNVAATVTTMDERVRSQLEPGGVTSARRVAMLKEFKKTDATTGMHVMPIIPYLTDSDENLAALCRAASEAGVDYLLPGTLHLRGRTRQCFFAFLAQCYPELYRKLYTLYEGGGAGSEYKKGLYARFNKLRQQYGISTSYMAPMRERLSKKPPEGQLSFFADTDDLRDRGEPWE